MTRAEALARALETVASLSYAPTNTRGYTDSSYRPPTLGERTAAVLRVAAFLIETDPTEETE
jgi:hypothetical protein